ncbi:MAG: hypothetical protein CMR00_05185 [[Chlorobium] sp. 445]|nr:MAG: hypothetical protein CMR00_05185 [[Chlorobium] sp. 445]
MKRILFAVVIGCFALFAVTSSSNAFIFKSDNPALVSDSTEKKSEEKPDMSKKAKKKTKKKEKEG